MLVLHPDLLMLQQTKVKTPQSIIYMERPADSTPMKVHTVAPVTNEGYFKTLAELNKDAIIMSHRLSRLILGFEQATGWNKDAFKDNILITMETVIASLQKKRFLRHMILSFLKLIQ